MERRDPTVCHTFDNMGGRGAMTTTPISLQDLRRRIYAKAKAVWAVADWLTRRTTPAGWERQHGDKDTLSNWRDPPRPAAKSVEAREVV